MVLYGVNWMVLYGIKRIVLHCANRTELHCGNRMALHWINWAVFHSLERQAPNGVGRYHLFCFSLHFEDIPFVPFMGSE